MYPLLLGPGPCEQLPRDTGSIISAQIFPDGGCKATLETSCFDKEYVRSNTRDQDAVLESDASSLDAWHLADLGFPCKKPNRSFLRGMMVAFPHLCRPTLIPESMQVLIPRMRLLR